MGVQEKLMWNPHGFKGCRHNFVEFPGLKARIFKVKLSNLKIPGFGYSEKYILVYPPDPPTWNSPFQSFSK